MAVGQGLGVVMLDQRRGNILTSKADAIVIPVNTVGVMGAGLAKAAADRWPGLRAAHKRWCALRQYGGAVQHSGIGPVVFAATKEDWRHPSKLTWVIDCLRRLQLCDASSLAIPMLGCGLGGLPESDVLPWIERAFAEDPRIVEIWRP